MNDDALNQLNDTMEDFHWTRWIKSHPKVYPDGSSYPRGKTHRKR